MSTEVKRLQQRHPSHHRTTPFSTERTHTRLSYLSHRRVSAQRSLPPTPTHCRLPTAQSIQPPAVAVAVDAVCAVVVVAVRADVHGYGRASPLPLLLRRLIRTLFVCEMSSRRLRRYHTPAETTTATEHETEGRKNRMNKRTSSTSNSSTRLN